MPGEKLVGPRLVFIIAQFIFWGVLLYLFIRRGSRADQDSHFRPENLEARRRRWGARKAAPLHDVKATRILLEGFVFGRPAHETLGVPTHADARQISLAYRELMKRYHPDKVGPPGSREWKDAQAIAEAINQARDELLKKVKKPGHA